MKAIYKMSTWSNSPEASAMNDAATKAAKAHVGKKFIVSIGEWGVTTYMVFAETKEEAKALAATEFEKNGSKADKVKARDVTNAKKYQ